MALRNTTLRGAMRNATDTFTIKRADALSGMPLEEWREQASDMRMQVLDNLPEYVDRFERNATRAGAKVHRAKDSREARERIASILKVHGIGRVVKSKSMVSEEIHLNDYLESQGIGVVETDLGEYIIQIAGEGPSHIIVPAIHKDRRQVGKLFAEKLGGEYSDDPAVLTRIARNILREEFLSANAGISGANFAVADSGSIVLFTNEGNAANVYDAAASPYRDSVHRKDGSVVGGSSQIHQVASSLGDRAGSNHLHVCDYRDQKTWRIHRGEGDAHCFAGQRQIRNSHRGIPRNA